MAAVASEIQEDLERVPIDDIYVEEGFNNRRELGEVKELADSIKSLGLLQPLVVRRAPANGRSGYIVIAGHRRLEACRVAKLTTVPVRVLEMDEDVRLEALIVENLHRKDIEPLEEADGYQRLVKRGRQQKEIAEKVGRSAAHISKRLSLLRLPAAAQELLAKGPMSLSQALELVEYSDEPEVIEKVLEHFTQAQRNVWDRDHFSMSQSARSTKVFVDRRRKIVAAHDKLKADKVSDIKTDEYGSRPSNVVELGKGWNQLPITTAAHKKEPCHGAYVDGQGDIHHVCTKPSNHAKAADKAVAKVVRQMTTSTRSSHVGDDEARKKKSAATRARNKVLRERAPLRLAELARVLDSRGRKEDVLDFTLRQLVQRVLDESGGPAELAAQVLGIPKSTQGPAWSGYLNGGPVAGRPERLLKIAFALALSMGEEPIRKLPERGYFESEYLSMFKRYFAHLEAAGYQPDPVERAELKQSNGYGWRGDFDAESKKKGEGETE